MNWKFLAIPGSVLSDSRITPAAKLVFGLLRYRQYDKGSCWPGIESISRDLALSRSAVSRTIGQLEKIGYISVERLHKRSNSYTVSTIRDDRFLRIRLDLAALPGLSAMDKLILSMLDYLSSNDSGRAWIHQQTLADRLGCNRSTIHRALSRLEKLEHIQIDHRGGGRKRGNLYRISPAFLNRIMQHGPEKTVAKRGAKDKDLKEIKRTPPKSQDISKGNLSSGTKTRAYCALLRQRVNKKTAQRIIFEHCHPPESVHHAIENALNLEPVRHAQGKPFSIPAYIVGSLNQARGEAHEIGLNRLAIENRQRQRAAERARGKPYTGPGELIKDISKRSVWIEAQKRQLGVA